MIASVWLSHRDAERLEAVAKSDGLEVSWQPWQQNRFAIVHTDADFFRRMGLEPGKQQVQRLGGEFEEAERWMRRRGSA